MAQTEVFTYVYLGLGVLLMFGPVVWLALSSFKTPAGLVELYNTPCNAFVAGFMGSPRMNLLDGVVKTVGAQGMTVTLGASEVLLPRCDAVEAGARVTIGVRPEHLAVKRDTNTEHDLVVSVALAEQLGGETYLYCDADDLPQLTVHGPGQMPAQRGDRLTVRFERESLHRFDANGLAVLNDGKEAS